MSRPLLYVASESPRYEDAKGYAGAHGRILDRMLQHAGCTRDDAHVIHADDWRDGMEADYGVVVLGGDVASTTALGGSWPTSVWHGSVLPSNPRPRDGYDSYRSWLLEPPKFVISYDIPTLHHAWDFHPLAASDWTRAGHVARGTYQQPNPDTYEWVVNDPTRLFELADVPVLVFDTELTPVWMFGCATDKQVHITNWDWQCEAPVRELMQSPTIMKVAHNLQHDLAMCELRFGVKVERPYFDTYGGCTLLNTALERTLSPGLASRFTNWPHHKWLYDVDAMHYNGLDNIVAYDGYQEIQRQLTARGLQQVAAHDHDLLEVLFAMQMTGFRVSEGERAKYEDETRQELTAQEETCAAMATPIIQTRLARFTKPHLFHVLKQCTCCGGGKVTALHCWRCGGLSAKPTNKSEYANGQVDEQPAYFPLPGLTPTLLKGATVATLRASLPSCTACTGTGKVGHWLPFNPGSGDAVADVLYRGLGIRARKYKGKETVAAAQLEPLQDKHPLIASLVTASKTRADLKTVERLRPGTDGCLHCVFDPWGTESGRVASKEGLLQPGTNAMNIPKKARRFVVPRPGRVFLYPDFSQIEARAVAVLSQDKGLLRAFTEPVDWPGNPKHGKIDSHTVVQQLMSKYVALSRDQCKRTTYALIYGGSGEQLAIELSKEAMQKGDGNLVTAQQGCNIREAFFLTFSGVRRWHEAIEQELLSTRTLRSPTGRERHWPGRIVDKDTGGVLNEVIKQAWSFKPQEMGAHLMALGVREIYDHHRDLLDPLVHVHDAVLFECDEARQAEATETAIRCLSREYMGMWFPTEMKAGSNWYEAS